jgi:hypothetical protein
MRHYDEESQSPFWQITKSRELSEYGKKSSGLPFGFDQIPNEKEI